MKKDQMINFRGRISQDGPFILNDQDSHTDISFLKVYIAIEENDRPQSEWISGLGVSTKDDVVEAFECAIMSLIGRLEVHKPAEFPKVNLKKTAAQINEIVNKLASSYNK